MDGVREMFFRFPEGRFCGTSFADDDYILRGLDQGFILPKGLSKDPFDSISEDGVPVFPRHDDTQAAVGQSGWFENKLVSGGVNHHILGVPFREIRPLGDAFPFLKGFSMDHHGIRRRDVFSPLPDAG
jgi:hypothetical protein